MQLKYVDTKEEIIAINRKTKHIEPHLHNALEIVCVTSGSLELGVGQELYHMEKGDIGFVFPDVIHHYQVLTPGVNKATYFKKKFSLEEMAKDLGVSKYVLSRLFSKTFHRNFNQYLNDARLNYACHRLENTSDSITNICLDSGFESQRTFNRVFKERYKISPSDYRSTCVKEMLS